MTNAIKKELAGRFWTRLSELVEAIEELGCDVCDANNEYITAEIEEDAEIIIYIGTAGSTIWVKEVSDA